MFHLKANLNTFDTQYFHKGNNYSNIILDYSNDNLNKANFLSQSLSASDFYCEVCYVRYPLSAKTIFDCQHFYCDSCVKEYFTLKISEGDIHLVKCLNADCLHKPSMFLLESILDRDIKEKYIKFKRRKEILLDPNKMICCYKDCDSFAYINKRNLTKENNMNEIEEEK